jgi:S-formylglutathione hydrolase FrmB
MALAEIDWYSQTLENMVAMSVILPDVGKGPFATFYLLHGLSDDHTAWRRRSRIEWYARQWPLIVVMPDGGRNFYTDNEDGPPYAEFFARELPAFVERTFPARTDRGGRCVGGLSMGGYGAMRLALGYPDRFASANSHSGALLAWRHDAKLTALSEAEHRRIFGNQSEGSSHDLIALATKAKRRVKTPKLRIDCGRQDELLGVSRTFHEELTRLGFEHEYAEFPGAHDWDYWDLHVREAIEFHAHALGLRQVPKENRPAGKEKPAGR